MKTNIAAPANTRLEVGQILNLLLADENVIYTTTRDYHWNVAGPEFLSLHQLFEHQYKELDAWSDQLAEHTRTMGAWARGNLAEMTASARLSADPGSRLAAENMIEELLALHEDMVRQLETDISHCTHTFSDAGTASFLTELMLKHRKSAWVLSMLLETDGEEETP